MQCLNDFTNVINVAVALDVISHKKSFWMQEARNWFSPNIWVFIAQLVEHCSANTEAMGSNPVFLAKIWNCLNCVTTNDQSSELTLFVQIFCVISSHLRWLNRVMQNHEARASDLNRKLIFSFFCYFPNQSYWNITNKGQNLLFNNHLWYQGF